jgi:hypothetical protein
MNIEGGVEDPTEPVSMKDRKYPFYYMKLKREV